MTLIEGFMPFLEYSTYYRIAGDPYSDKPPLLMLHGGPGSTHNYLELFDRLAESDHRQVILYDQLGCGRSYVDGHPELWTVDIWTRELCALIDYLDLEDFHLFGHSWGGMLALNYICQAPAVSCRSLILSSTTASSAAWKRAADTLIPQLPEAMIKAIRRAQSTGCYDEEAFLSAQAEYMRRFCAGRVPEDAPECLTRPLRRGREAYLTAWGPNEFTPTGTLKDFDITDQLSSIHIPTLVLSGEHDMCTPALAGELASAIPGSSRHIFPGTRHMSFAEDRDGFEEKLIRWLRAHEADL